MRTASLTQLRFAAALSLLGCAFVFNLSAQTYHDVKIRRSLGSILTQATA